MIVHIIKTIDVDLSITSLSYMLEEINKFPHSDELELHCSEENIKIAFEIRRHEKFNAYEIDVVEDKMYYIDAFFLTDGNFIVYSEGA